MIRLLLQRAGVSRFNRPRVVICVPSAITEVERRAVIEASRRAGAADAQLLEQPMAAYLGFPVPGRERRLLVGLPPARSWHQLRNAAWFRRGLRAKARDFNWHNVVGLWSVVPLFVIVLSGVVISYPWASDLLYRAAGEAPPARPPAAPGSSPRSGARDRDSAAAVAPSLDPLWARAERQVEGWRSISVRIPSDGGETAVFTIDTGTGGQPQKRGTLTLYARTADVAKWEPFSGLSTGRRWRSYLRFGHTGEVAGLAGQTIAGVASLGAVVLVWTGLSLALRRAAAWRVRRSAGRLEQVGRDHLRSAATRREDRDRVA